MEIIRKSTRGAADHGWLKAKHSFSFANYYDPNRVHFGALRVLNDDAVAPGMGFGTHPHDNMEIITIPLEGLLEHQDSMGHKEVIQYTDVQVMSAGTGIRHSEYNHSTTDWLKLLQIWIFPNQKNVTPRYGQVAFDPQRMHNNFQTVVTPYPGEPGSTWIHQNAWIALGRWDTDTAFSYTPKDQGNGVYLFVIEGSLNINGQNIATRDAVTYLPSEALQCSVTQNALVLVLDIPLTF